MEGEAGADGGGGPQQDGGHALSPPAPSQGGGRGRRRRGAGGLGEPPPVPLPLGLLPQAVWQVHQRDGGPNLSDKLN